MNFKNIKDRADDNHQDTYELINHCLHLESRLEAAHRAIAKISCDRPMFEDGSRHEYERAYERLKTIANDALAAWER